MANSSSFYGTGNEHTAIGRVLQWVLGGCLLTGSLLHWFGLPILPWWWKIGLAPVWTLLVFCGVLVLLYLYLVVSWYLT